MPDDSHQPQPPVVTKAPPAGKQFPCKKCGARVDFDPAAHALKCPYCGYTEPIKPSDGQVVEHDLQEYLAHHTGESTVQGRGNQVTCQACGAVVLLEDKVVTDKCPYCATHLENKPEAAKSMIAPECMLPFRIEKREAIERFSRWLEGLWFAPNALKQFANLGQINGVYVPFWTFDSMTYTWYTGERGDDYQETEYYTDTESYTDSSGQLQTRQVQKTRTVTKTRWTPVSGQVNHFFDDVAVCASKSLPAYYTATLTPKELKHVEPFKPEYLSSFISERYTIGPKEGFDHAKEIMDGQIRTMCMQDIGGNHQRLHTVQTKHVGVTFKHLLLPVWLASYRFQDKAYRVLVNGETGHVTGDRPYSWVKIVLLILVILAVIGTIIAIVVAFGAVQGGSRHGDNGPQTVRVAQLPVSRWSANAASLDSGASGTPLAISRNRAMASGLPMCSSASTAWSTRRVSASVTKPESSAARMSPSRRRTSADGVDSFAARRSARTCGASFASVAPDRCRVA
jgi:DNA-directed RNA polymerase subunit RPC12/RpoP